MKNKIKAIALCGMILSLLFVLFAFGTAFSADEEEPTVQINSKIDLPETVRVGDTFDVTLSVNTPLAFVANGALAYDREKLEFVEAKSPNSDWIVTSSEVNGVVSYLCVDILLEHPIQGETALVSFTFTVKEGTLEGDELLFSCGDIAVSDGSTDSVISGCTQSVSLYRQLSSVASLSGISIGSQPLEGFSSDVKEYSLTVGNETESLDITYECDEFAKVEIIGNELAVGENTVKLRVWSEDETTITDYILKVKREHPEGYNGLSDSSIKEITLSSGHITPSFDPAVFEYVIYITSDVKSITVSTTPSVETSIASELVIDTAVNKVHKLVCTSQDGNISEYSFTVKFISEESQVPGGEEGNENDKSDNDSRYGDIIDSVIGKLKSGDAAVVVILVVIIAVVAITAFFIGFIIAFPTNRKKKKYKKNLPLISPDNSALPVQAPSVEEEKANDDEVKASSVTEQEGTVIEASEEKAQIAEESTEEINETKE